MRTDALDLERVIFIGRTYEEYLRLFGLDERLLRAGWVLDCAAGPSSFAARAARRGVQVVAADLVYDLPLDRLVAKGRADLDLLWARFPAVQHLYVWSHITSLQALQAAREQALREFAADFPAGRDAGRYVTAALPRLPFRDRQFHLVLCSHFIFLYGDRLDLAFHLAALRELVRVAAGEVRIYPLVGLDVRPYAHLDAVSDALRAEGVGVDRLDVDFEFQPGATQVLRLTPPGAG